MPSGGFFFLSLLCLYCLVMIVLALPIVLSEQHKHPGPRQDFLFCSLYFILVLIVLAVPFILTVQHTQHKHPCPRRDSNPQSQQAIGRRHAP